MALQRRTHRRDRRKTAPATQGGRVDGLSTVIYSGTTGAYSVPFLVLKSSGALAPPHFEPVKTVGRSGIDPTGFFISDDGVELTITDITIDENGQGTITVLEPLGGNIIYIIPPFRNELRSVTGDVCAGGILYTATI